MGEPAKLAASAEDPVRDLSHDVRNHLYALRTELDILKASPPVRDADASHRLGELLEWMDRDLGRLTEGVNQLVSLARERRSE
jgi:signal transduction histidine kinase